MNRRSFIGLIVAAIVSRFFTRTTEAKPSPPVLQHKAETWVWVYATIDDDPNARVYGMISDNEAGWIDLEAHL